MNNQTTYKFNGFPNPAFGRQVAPGTYGDPHVAEAGTAGMLVGPKAITPITRQQFR